MNRSRSLLLFILLIITLAALYATWYLLQSQQRAASTAGQVFMAEDAPVFTDETGEAYEFAIADGSLQVVTLWATWVPNIEKHLATVSEVVQQHSESVSIIAVNRDEPAERVEAFFSTRFKPGNITFLQNPGDKLYGELDSYAMPETVIFDGEGEIVWRQRGIVQESKLQTAVENAIDK